MEVTGVVDRGGANGGQRAEKPQVILNEGSSGTPAFFFSHDSQDSDHRVARHHRGDQGVATARPEQPGRSRRQGTLGRQSPGNEIVFENAIGASLARVDAEGEEILHLKVLVQREDESNGGIENGHRSLHELFEKLFLRTQRVQRSPDVIQRLELQKLSPQLKCGRRQLVSLQSLRSPAFAKKEVAVPFIIKGA